MINPNIYMRVYVTVNEDGKTATINKGQGKGMILELTGEYYDSTFKPGQRIRPVLKYSISSNQYWLDARKGR